MFVITADQVDSTHRADLVQSTITLLTERWEAALLLPVDRTAGDELQLMTVSGAAALEIVLALTRTANWSVGLGIGSVSMPLPTHTREANGPAFVAARSAVDAAKKRDGRFALRGAEALAAPAADLEAVIDLLLITRTRRSREGWELFDLLSRGSTQAAAALELGITPQAASKRARAGAIKTEMAAVTALSHMLATVDSEKIGR